MTLIKIAAVGAVLIVLMAVGRDQKWLQKAGVVGTCVSTAAPASQPGDYWYACKEGVMSGFPALESDHCTSIGVARKREIWQCDQPELSLPSV